MAKKVETKADEKKEQKGKRPVRSFLFGLVTLPTDGSINIFGITVRGEYPESKEKMDELTENSVVKKP